MKKLLSGTVLLFAAFGLQAQTGWNIGDQGSFGHGFQTYKNSNNYSAKFHPTFQLGRRAIYNFNENFGLGFGTYFSSEGETRKINASNDFQHRPNYIRVPVFANITLGNGANRIRPRFTIGPSVGFLVGGKTYTINDNGNFAGTKTHKLLRKDVDAGIQATFGIIGKVKDGIYITHDIGYYHGLVDQTNMIDNNSYQARNIYLSMGFLINKDAMKRWKHNMGGTWREKKHVYDK